MSAPGHCRHCEEGCTGDTPILGWPDDEPHTDDNGATWPGGGCFACDEAERIAQLCDEEAVIVGLERLPDHDARAQTWQAAANLARGQR